MTEAAPLAPSTRRSVVPLGRLSAALGRAIERGDPRLGLFVGIPVALLVALGFSLRLPIFQRLDNIVLDKIFFQCRGRVSESDRILNVDIDDATLRQLSYPIGRNLHAEIITELDRLGAKLIAFDVEFKADIRRAGGYRSETGEFILDDKEAALSSAIARSGKVMLGYHFDFDDPLRGARSFFGTLKAELARDFSAGAQEISARTGIPSSSFQSEFEGIRELAALEIADEQLSLKPDMTFPEFARSHLPKPQGMADAGNTRVLQYAYWMARTRFLLDARSLEVVVEGAPAGCREGRSLVPPLFPFFERALSVGIVNADYDSDGVLRRPPAFLVWGKKPRPYLGLAAGVYALLQAGESARLRVRPEEMRIEIQGRPNTPPRRILRLPLDQEGRILVNWAGNDSLQRDWFSRLPFVGLVSAYEDRYVLMDANFRKLVSDVGENSGEPYHPEYLKLSDALQEILSGRRVVEAPEFRAIEDKLDAIRAEIMKERAEEVASLDAQLPSLVGKDRLYKRTKEAREKYQAQLDSLRAPYEREKDLQKLVQGRVCLIGAAHSGSGDLHSTPLGPMMPGVDVHTNVTNMVLTNQWIRRGSSWIDFASLFGVGLLVSLAVVHWKTAASLLASSAVVGMAFALGWYLFTRPVILVSGMGPLASFGATYLATIIFKELVTQRSKRKLQKELEKNTSPELVKILMEHSEILAKPRKMTGTFFFSDVKSFTSISEKMPADVLFPFINRYLDRMTQALKRHQAYIDKYMGDGIMALFGVPVATPEHARNACLAALDCQAAMKGLNLEFAREGLPLLTARIGINSGEVNAGYVGATDRSDYTVLGDAANLASRLEGANKEYDTLIVLSESTLALVPGQFVTRELDRIRVVGKKLPVRIYELLAPAGGPLPLDPGFLEAYQSALKLFQGRQWQESIEAFERALAQKPGDKPCENYVARANEFLVNPPPADWEGVFDLHSK